MNFLAVSIMTAILGGIGFYFGRNEVSANASMLLTFQGIIAAAVLVRLNRGVPSLDWKAVQFQAVERLLERLEDIAKSYIAVVIINAISIAILLFIQFYHNPQYPYSANIIMTLSTIFGALLGLLLGRMAHVVWLDLDIVRLQKAVILSAAESENKKIQIANAAEKMSKMDKVRITAFPKETRSGNGTE